MRVDDVAGNICQAKPASSSSVRSAAERKRRWPDTDAPLGMVLRLLSSAVAGQEGL